VSLLQEEIILYREYPEVTSNIVDLNTTLSKSKQLALCSEESDTEHSSDLKELLIEPEGIYQHTRIRTRAIAQVDYNALARGTKANDKHSAIAESKSSNSHMEKEAFAYMASTPKRWPGDSKSKLSAEGAAGDALIPVRVYQRAQVDDNSFAEKLEEDVERFQDRYFIQQEQGKTKGR